MASKIESLRIEIGSDSLELINDLRRIREEFKKLEQETKNLNNEFSGLHNPSKSILGIAKELGILAIKSEQVRSSLIGMGINLTRVGRGFSDFREVAAIASTGVVKFAGAVSSYLRIAQPATMAAGTIALSVGLKSAISAGAEFESAMAELASVTGASGQDLDILSQSAKDFSSELGGTASNVAESFTLMASAKPELLNDLDALRGATQEAIILSQAADMSVQDSVTALASSLNQFGEGADQSSRYINVLAAGAKLGSAMINETADALKNAGTEAAAAGISFEATNAIIQVLAEVGLKSSEAGTQIRNMVGILTGSGDKFEKLGIDASSVNPEIVGLETALSNLGKAQLTSAQYSEVFGIENKNAARQIIENKDKVLELTTAMTGTNIAYEQAAIQNATLTKAMSDLAAKANLVGIEVYENLTPTVVLDAINLLDVFANEAIKAVNSGGGISAFFQQTFSEIGQTMKGVAQALPEALDLVDFSSLLNSLNSLKGSILGVFGDLDLTKPRDLADVIQFVTDSIAGMIQTSSGFVQAATPFFGLAVKTAEAFNGLGSSFQKVVGWIEGIKAGWSALSPVISFIGFVAGVTLLTSAFGILTKVFATNLLALNAVKIAFATFAPGIGTLYTLLVALAPVIAVVGAAFAGWKIGSWLFNEFKIVRDVAYSTIGAILKLWEDLKYGALIAWKEIVSVANNTMTAIQGTVIMVVDDISRKWAYMATAFSQPIAYIQSIWNELMSYLTIKLSGWVDTLSSLTSSIDFLPGMGDATAKLSGFSQQLAITSASYKRAATEGNEFVASYNEQIQAIDAETDAKLGNLQQTAQLENEITALNEQRLASKASIDEVVTGLISEGNASQESVKATQESSKATKNLATNLKKDKGKNFIKESTEDAKALFKTLSEMTSSVFEMRMSLIQEGDPDSISRTIALEQEKFLALQQLIQGNAEESLTERFQLTKQTLGQALQAYQQYAQKVKEIEQAITEEKKRQSEVLKGIDEKANDAAKKGMENLFKKQLEQGNTNAAYETSKNLELKAAQEIATKKAEFAEMSSQIEQAMQAKNFAKAVEIAKAQEQLGLTISEKQLSAKEAEIQRMIELGQLSEENAARELAAAGTDAQTNSKAMVLEAQERINAAMSQEKTIAQENANAQLGLVENLNTSFKALLEQFSKSKEGTALDVRFIPDSQEIDAFIAKMKGEKIDIAVNPTGADAIGVSQNAGGMSFAEVKGDQQEGLMNVSLKPNSEELDAYLQAKQEQGLNVKLMPDSAQVDSLINRLKEPTTSTHTITVTKEGVTAATGGLIKGPGTTTSDSIPAWLSNREYVIPAKSVDYFGVDFFHSLRSLQIPRFATGGLATAAGPQTFMNQITNITNEQRDLNPIQVNVGDHKIPLYGRTESAKALRTALRDLKRG